ncbi:MAG: HEAT repeat domain-containing protein [Acidobacteriota bacterium]
MESIKGEQRNQLKAIFNQALRKKTLRDINSFRLRKRLRATRVFIMFSSFYDSNQIMKLLRDKPAVRLAALDSLARVSNEEAISQIFNVFIKDPDPNIQEYMNVLFSLGQKAEHLIKIYLKKPLSNKKLALLIEITGAIPLPNLYPELLRFLEHQEMEIRTKLARALGNLNTPLSEIRKALMKLARDKAWQVRAQALKSLGNLQNFQALDLLTESLFSPHWHCRRNAGFALLKLGQKGFKRLQQIANQKKDKYAAEMAQMVLEESIIT